MNLDKYKMIADTLAQEPDPAQATDQILHLRKHSGAKASVLTALLMVRLLDANLKERAQTIIEELALAGGLTL